MANDCLNYGIRMFGRSFPVRMLSAHKPKGSNLQRSTFCFRCYAMNDHSDGDCPKPPEFTICSECSSANHSWRNGTSTKKSASTALENTEQCQTSAPTARKLALEKNMQNKRRYSN